MGNYKIKVKVEFIECDTQDACDPKQQDDGSFEMVINEQDAISIDESEKALMLTAYPSIRKAIAEHLATISPKKLLKKPKTDQ